MGCRNRRGTLGERRTRGADTTQHSDARTNGGEPGGGLTGSTAPDDGPDGGADAGPDDGAEPGDGRTGRRQLLSLAGMAAAGAVAGTTVLASQATPAAINWSSGGQNIASSATVTVSPTGGLTVRCGGTGASTDVIVDVAGYYL